jgi:endo-1,4-beta-xylanase
LGGPNSTGWVQQNLVWAYDQWIPEWLLQEEANITSNKAKQLLSDYIHAVVGRYRGKILCWDVINEALQDTNNTNPFNLRDSFWLRKLGPDFIKYAFQFAHEVDPNVQLYYNEFGIETAIVHGISLQWHMNASTTIIPGDDHYLHIAMIKKVLLYR